MDQAAVSPANPASDLAPALLPAPLPRPRRERRPTPRMLRFVDEYRHDRNAVQAALRAGYGVAFAKSNSYRMLKDPRISSLIHEEPDPDYPEMTGALRELGRLAFSNVMDLVRVDPDGRIHLDPARIDRRRAAGVRELIIDETIDKATGNIRRQVKLRMADRKDALVKLIAGLRLDLKAYEEGVEHGRDEVLLRTSVEQFKRESAARKREANWPKDW